MDDYFSNLLSTRHRTSLVPEPIDPIRPTEAGQESRDSTGKIGSVENIQTPLDVHPIQHLRRMAEGLPSFLPGTTLALPDLFPGRPFCRKCLSSDKVRKRDDYTLADGELREYWSCDGCGHRVPPNITGRRRKAQTVGDVLSRFYRSESILDIENGLLEYGEHLGPSGILDYVEAYPYLIARTLCLVAQKYGMPGIGNIWQLDEKPTKIAGIQFWIMAIIDITTHFVLVLRVFKSRTVENLTISLLEARRLAKKCPLIVETDGLTAYPRAVRRALGDATHWRVKKSEWYGINNLVEHFNSKLEVWLRHKKRLHELNTAQHIIDGVWIQHNFVRPSTSQYLLKQQPAQVAGFPVQFERPWTDSLLLAERAALLGHVRFLSPRKQKHIDQWSPNQKHRESRQKTFRAKSKTVTG